MPRQADCKSATGCKPAPQNPLLLSYALGIALLAPLSAQPLRLETTIPLSVRGRIDHMSPDVAGKRLFVAALGNNSVEVVDVAAGKVTRSLKGFEEPQGVLFWPGGNRLYVANGKTGNVNALDGSTLAGIRTYQLDSDADNIRVEPAAKEVYVGYGEGALAVLQADAGERVGDVMLNSHPESFQLEANGPRIFVNVPGAQRVAVVDRRTRTVSAKWGLSAEENFPMALDEANHRLFIGCRKPPKLIVLDTSTGKEVASADIVADTDDLFYDAALHRVYASGGAGAVTVIQQNGPDSYAVGASIPTAPKARTSLFVPGWKQLIVAAPKDGKQGARLLVFATN